MGGIYIQDNRPMRKTRSLPNLFEEMEKQMEVRRDKFMTTFNTMLDDISSFMEEHPEKIKVNVHGPLGDIIKKLQDKIDRIEETLIPKRRWTKEPTKVELTFKMNKL